MNKQILSLLLQTLFIYLYLNLRMFFKLHSIKETVPETPTNMWIQTNIMDIVTLLLAQ